MIDAPSNMAAPSSPSAKARRRPFGLLAIIVLQVLMMLVSGFLLAILAAVFLYSERIIPMNGFDTSSVNLTSTVDVGPVEVGQLALIFVVNAICAVGLWWRRRWAWLLTMLQLGFFMTSDLYSYFTHSPPETYAWSMLLNVFIVFYLNQRDVQAIFLDKNEG